MESLVVPIYKSTVKNVNKKPPKPHKPKKPISRDNLRAYVCASLMVVFLLCFLVIILPTNMFKTFLLGSFGLFSYPLFLFGAVLCIAGINKSKYVLDKRYLIYLSCILFLTLILFHLILTSKLPSDSYKEYLLASYNSQISAGGIIMSLLVYPLKLVLTNAGAFIFTSIGLAIFVALLVDYIATQKIMGKEPRQNNFDFTGIDAITPSVPITLDAKIQKSKKEIAKSKLGIEKNESEIISSTIPVNDVIEKLSKSRPMSKREYILTPADIVMPPQPQSMKQRADSIIVQSESIKENITEQKIEIPAEKPFLRPENMKMFQKQKPDTIQQSDMDLNSGEQFFEDEEIQIDEESDINVENEDSNLYVSQDSEIKFGDTTEKTVVPTYNIDKGITLQTNDTNFERKFDMGEKPQIVPKEISEPQQSSQPICEYVKPTIDLLDDIEVDSGGNEEDCQQNIEKLEKVLDDFKVPAKVIAYTIGPAVTRYEISMPTGISVKKVQMHSDDIAMALASNGAIRIEAPIPGKNAVGIEVPNNHITSVSLKELIDSKQFKERVNPLSFVLGKDINGDIQFCNLDKMPHLLVAGSTGSGKSVCLNALIVSLIYRNSPQDLRLILIDPKMVEFNIYENLPHLLTPHIITNKDQAINCLNWAIAEMERRYKLLMQNHVVNIKEYNNLPFVKSDFTQKLPFIVIVIDELADFMLEAKRDMEDRIMKLAQKARAAGIHLVIATQRPSVDVITGTIKANLPSRVSFALTNFADSKTVIDQSGAEKLLGKGDMLYKPQDFPEPKRVQGAYVSSQEVASVVKYIKENNAPQFDEATEKAITKIESETPIHSNGKVTEFDPILKDVLRWFIQSNQASITLIQRRFGVGFARAARIIDQMEDNGFISAQDGSKPRSILIDMEKFKEKFGE